MLELENRRENLAPFSTFLHRVFRFGLFALALVLFSVAVGTVGYHYYANLNLTDSFYMACMILTGMGPTVEMKSNAAKIFSSVYALYSGVAFLSVCAVFFTPFIHRLLHKLHVDDDEAA